ncbi:response regulator transcription factor [Sutcliffiella rhizosphaerae]|uniref:Response regulatory protein n=1 Tax=Sutcliffiella rhizosphaerae TaxID=2880967 RepID=A0ABM8YTA4_9BACI|nr:helix-turn-helix domain-containing protein [Sutcliffiella rhizosphaerae]CAG9623250.1 putative response regulatory protein [Sutcliffiella rhizosphaerae]
MLKAIIIDDEKHVREGLQLLGSWMEFGIDTVLEARDGEEAIMLIKKHRPEIIFTDMQMPKRDGISLLKWIAESELEAITIVVSGHDDFKYMRNAIYYKSFDYILKPIDPDLLHETLERAVEKWKEETLHKRSSGDMETIPFLSDVPSSNMQKIAEYLRVHYQQDITLQEMADRFFMSREHISRKFKQEYQETITDYVTRIRMEKAKELLANQSLKIYEIAYHIGYQNEKYFSKVYKKLFGITPNEYRNTLMK